MITHFRNLYEISCIKMTGKKPGVRVMFVNHEESYTGAPEILFQIIDDYWQRFDRSEFRVISKRKDSAHHRFNARFPMVYPGDIYPKLIYPHLSAYERARQILDVYQPDLVYANSVDSFEYCVAAK